MSAAKKRQTTRAEQEKLLEEFFKNLGNERFWDMPSFLKVKILVNLIALQMKIMMKKVLPMRRKSKQIYKKQI